MPKRAAPPAASTPAKAAALSVAMGSNSPRDWFRPVGPKKTGDNLEETENNSLFMLLSEMMDQFAESPGDIQLVATEAKRIKRLREERAGDALGECFPSFGKVRSLSEDILIKWVVDVSDLPQADVMKAKKFDPESPFHLYSCGTGCSLQLKLPDELKVVDVWKSWSNARHSKLGEPLKHMKKRTQPNGQIDWKDVCLELKFSEKGILTQVKHVPSNTLGKLPERCQITRDYDFKNFWSESEADCKVDPFPGTKMLNFFEKGNPALFGYALGINRKDCDKLIDEDAKHHYEEYKKKLAAVVSIGEDKRDVDAIRKNLKDIKAAGKKEQMSEVRKKAMGAVATKQAKCKLNF